MPGTMCRRDRYSMMRIVIASTAVNNAVHIAFTYFGACNGEFAHTMLQYKVFFKSTMKDLYKTKMITSDIGPACGYNTYDKELLPTFKATNLKDIPVARIAWSFNVGWSEHDISLMIKSIKSVAVCDECAILCTFMQTSKTAVAYKSPRTAAQNVLAILNAPSNSSKSWVHAFDLKVDMKAPRTRGCEACSFMRTLSDI
ncbi:hypothetical protein CEUSTIGMA_g9234.t1 [Chlamydomonas eustigma]|uniref:Uncharacterized protein n=1 Tax=Chlamydomonas eustigma TaxID=1157962 RepID=A0A250XFJ3_9CHLO|nr:hypothetical protein CEUSTIGMA_g9234.t1 [Chlamydomonas eustigma]|eukprot:GAX81806.1 hypothetical protein CEUSTIGMA_g9234.t1 [Chlamydomonas eustigma]